MGLPHHKGTFRALPSSSVSHPEFHLLCKLITDPLLEHQTQRCRTSDGVYSKKLNHLNENEVA